MGFNYAAEKKKFETLWARLRREYRAAGMPDAAIQKMHDFDWEVFKTGEDLSPAYAGLGHRHL